MADHRNLSRLLATVAVLEKTLSSQARPRPHWRSTGRVPQCEIPSAVWLLPPPVTSCISPRLREIILSKVVNEIDKLRQKCLALYAKTIGTIASLEDVGGMPDHRMEAMVCGAFASAYTLNLETLRQSVMGVLANTSRSQTVERGKKGNGFGSHANSVLEEAFSVHQTLTSAECTIIAGKAGITYQQVRTWYQNKRNRKRTGDRRTASHSEVQQRVTEPVIPHQRRVISALPKRATAPSDLPPPPSASALSTRPVRGLPRRAQHASLFPVPSTTSVSSLDSIPPSGGLNSFIPHQQASFTSPEITSNTLSFPWSAPSGETPAFNFTPPTPLNADFNFNLDTEMIFNIDDILPPWSNADFTSLLNSVLNDPTLAGSPVFTYSALGSPSQGGTESEGWTSNSVEEDFFALLDGFCRAESSEGGDGSLSDSPLIIDTADLGAANQFPVNLSPLDMLDGDFPCTTESSANSLPSEPSSRSSSPSFPLITPTHPHALSRSTSHSPLVTSLTMDDGINPSAWTSGVLAFDCDGAEWEGFEEKMQSGGEWDFSDMLAREMIA